METNLCKKLWGGLFKLIKKSVSVKQWNTWRQQKWANACGINPGLNYAKLMRWHLVWDKQDEEKKNSGSFMCDNKAKRIIEIKISSSDCFAAVCFFFPSFFQCKWASQQCQACRGFFRARARRCSSFRVFLPNRTHMHYRMTRKSMYSGDCEPAILEPLLSEGKLCKNDQLFKCTRGDRRDLRSVAPSHIRKVTRSQLGLHLYECKAAATFNPEQKFAGA